ncbi:hypothetical protein J3F83DRAFT_752070 [Trichoderma novae-zelandiae]
MRRASSRNASFGGGGMTSECSGRQLLTRRERQEEFPCGLPLIEASEGWASLELMDKDGQGWTRMGHGCWIEFGLCGGGRSGWIPDRQPLLQTMVEHGAAWISEADFVGEDGGGMAREEMGNEMKTRPRWRWRWIWRGRRHQARFEESRERNKGNIAVERSAKQVNQKVCFPTVPKDDQSAGRGCGVQCSSSSWTSIPSS